MTSTVRRLAGPAGVHGSSTHCPETTIRQEVNVSNVASAPHPGVSSELAAQEGALLDGEVPKSEQRLLQATVGRVARGQAKYERQGFFFPILGLSPEETTAALAGFKRCRERSGAKNYSMHHVSQPWLCNVAKHPWILDAVAAVFRSQDIYLYSSHLFAREAGHSLHSSTGLDWHQDGEQFLRRLDPVDSTHFATVFLALSVCDEEHGCLRARPLCGGEEVNLELQPGQFSLHGPFTMHTGGLNSSGETRYCIALRYVAASTRCIDGCKDALLVRGTDSGQHFTPMTEPQFEDDPAGESLRSTILQRRSRSARDYSELSAYKPAVVPAVLHRGASMGPACVSQLWEVACNRVSVRRAPRAGAEVVGLLVRGDIVYVRAIQGSWVCLDGRGVEPGDMGAALAEQWVLTELRRPSFLTLLKRVW